MSKTMLITGGARGIGRATALRAAEAGFDVAVGYRADADAAEATCQAIRERDRQAIAVMGDVGEEADILALFAAVDNAFGRLDALVNSAGVSGLMLAHEADAAGLHRLMAVNVIGLMLCCREAIGRMRGRGGCIVNVGSMAAVGGGRPGSIHYAGSKGAVDSYTTGLAKEIAPLGIRVNAVRPGVTMTDMVGALRQDEAKRAAVAKTIPMGRVGQPEEIAAAIVFLCSEEAGFITGAHLDASGGGFVIGAATR